MNGPLRRVYNRRRVIALTVGGVASAGYLLKRQESRSTIPFLITADVHNRPTICEELASALEYLGKWGAKATFLVSADVTRKPHAVTVLRSLIAAGHQVGCHGFVHDLEDYSSDGFDKQWRNVRSAKDTLENSLSTPVTTFRAPAFRIASYTLKILDSLGFRADLSVCSQRLPLLSSQIGNYHWIVAPRVPYHPNAADPYSTGDLKLLEIPTSAAILPLMSTLNNVSLLATKVTTTFLRYEAAIRTKPLVYQCHPDDFGHLAQQKESSNFNWRSALPTDGYGIPLRRAFATKDSDVIYRRSQEFFAFLRDTKTFRFQTVDDYLTAHSPV